MRGVRRRIATAGTHNHIFFYFSCAQPIPLHYFLYVLSPLAILSVACLQRCFDILLTARLHRHIVVPSVWLLTKEMIPESRIHIIDAIPLIRRVVTVRLLITIQTLRHTLCGHIAMKIAHRTLVHCVGRYNGVWELVVRRRWGGCYGGHKTGVCCYCCQSCCWFCCRCRCRTCCCGSG